MTVEMPSVSPVTSSQPTSTKSEDGWGHFVDITW
jgi:hypothetical protein